MFCRAPGTIRSGPILWLAVRPSTAIFDPRTARWWKTSVLKPITPYAVTKAATELMGYQYFKNYGMKVFLPRMFIHVGTGHPPATAIQNFARQLALIAKGRLEPVLRVGNLDTARDFIDVRDGVNGMMFLLEKGTPGVPVNICTGTAHSIRDTLNQLIAASQLKVRVETDPGLLRPTDEPLLLGDNSRFGAGLAAAPRIRRNLGCSVCRLAREGRQTLEAVHEESHRHHDDQSAHRGDRASSRRCRTGSWSSSATRRRRPIIAWSAASMSRRKSRRSTIRRSPRRSAGTASSGGTSGLLWANDMQADIVAVVDDDNIPLEGWGENLLVGREVEVDYYETDLPAFDPVGATNHRHLWHRGFPLQLLPKRDYARKTRKTVRVDMQADFWNGDPDIDAVCRMEHAPECNFDPAVFPHGRQQARARSTRRTRFSAARACRTISCSRTSAAWTTSGPPITSRPRAAASSGTRPRSISSATSTTWSAT